jgi:hypothetical protein
MIDVLPTKSNDPLPKFRPRNIMHRALTKRTDERIVGPESPPVVAVTQPDKMTGEQTTSPVCKEPLKSPLEKWPDDKDPQPTSTSTAAPAFVTSRMSVYRVDYVPDPTADPNCFVAGNLHAVFFAIDETSGNVAPAVIATVRLRDCWVEWCETMTNRRRHGLAKELLEGIELHLDQTLVVSGCTPSGVRLQNSMEADR